VLENPTPRRWLIVSALTTGGLILVSGLVGICGLLFVGPGDNLLEEFRSHVPLINIARLSMSLAACSGIAYNVFMPRVAITAVMQLFAPRWTVKLPTTPGNRFRRNVVHIIVTTLLLASALTIAIFFDKLGLTYEIIGAVAGVSIGLIFPPLCILALSKEGILSSRSNIFALATLIIGAASMIGCVVSLVLP
jgi:amino acid permease